MKLECGSCGAQYPSDLPKHWGRTEETNGYGPIPKCIALVPTLAAVEEASRARRVIVKGTDAHEVCGGFLAAIPEDAADASRLITLTLNGEGPAS